MYRNIMLNVTVPDLAEGTLDICFIPFDKLRDRYNESDIVGQKIILPYSKTLYSHHSLLTTHHSQFFPNIAPCSVFAIFS